jgi:protein phosphatase
MRLLSVADVGLSDIGRKRGHNEDCFAIETSIQKKESTQASYFNAKGLFIVCDGMGGHASGEIASAMAVKNIYRYFQQHWTDEIPDAEIIKEGILQANDAIYTANIQKGQTGSGRMGTTLAMTFLQNTKIAIAHVGDSRIYKVTRKWGLEQLTIDHSVAQSEIKHGVESDIAHARPDAYQLTQALGPRDNNFVHPDINYFDIKEDTLILICSDGLCDNDLLENHWESALLPLISSKANLETGITQIIDLGNQINGHDNITCILIRIKVQPNLEHQNPIF